MNETHEPVILVDQDDNEIEIRERSDIETDSSKIIRYVYVLLFNDEKQLLLQERAADLKRFPNHWEVSASGAVWKDEGYVDAANRKLTDELNMKVPLFHEHKSVVEIPGKASRMIATFVGYADTRDLVQPNPEKVKEVRWVNPEEALKGFQITPSCEVMLKWWLEHGDQVMENVKELSNNQ